MCVVNILCGVCCVGVLFVVVVVFVESPIAIYIIINLVSYTLHIYNSCCCFFYRKDSDNANRF